VPFKLLSEYIEVLGGVSSPAFEQFRKLFVRSQLINYARGFQACQKHQEKILILAKMMFTGHGTTLPCFKRGFQSLEDLEARFNPPCKNELELYVFAQ
jgi:phosphatidylinositol 4-kinase